MPDMGAELQGRCAIVATTDGGEGLAIARQLARAGASVVLTGWEPGRGEAAAQAIRQEGRDALFVAAHDHGEADWAMVVAQAEAAFGRLDIAVFSADRSEEAPTSELSIEAFRAVGHANLKTVFLGLKHAAGAMRRGGRGGAVVVVSSLAGRTGLAHHIHYCASKAGLELLVKAAALELGPEHIRVNTILPAFSSPLEAGCADGDGAPDEIAKAVLFLASDRSIFMTGAEVALGGSVVRS